MTFWHVSSSLKASSEIKIQMVPCCSSIMTTIWNYVQTLNFISYDVFNENETCQRCQHFNIHILSIKFWQFHDHIFKVMIIYIYVYTVRPRIAVQFLKLYLVVVHGAPVMLVACCRGIGIEQNIFSYKL